MKKQFQGVKEHKREATEMKEGSNQEQSSRKRNAGKTDMDDESGAKEKKEKRKGVSI